MALTPGTRLGVYEVVASIGEGGMGQVFRARDTKLDRDVAIKILPEAFAHDADRLARFQREAKTLASLNHPNIAAIHGLEESGGVTALVMELVEGDDLSQRIARGAIPLDEALPIAKQIAEALEAAHEQGIIHRDLKPANIRVRPDGTVKVLDFGLAKAMEQPGLPSVSQSPTITTPAMTQMGMILGTAAYISPEQAKGRPADQRSDIWAFGVVMCEMLSGRRLFDGDSVAGVLAKVLERELDFTALPSTTPPSIRKLLRRCLERDRKRRLHHIADARVEIEEVLAGTHEEAAAHVTESRTAGTRWLTWSLGAAALVLAAATGWAAWTRTHPEPSRVMRFEITTPSNAPPRVSGGYSDVAISPDGAHIVYTSGDTASTARLYLRSIDQVEATPVRGSERGGNPFFSPDGQRIGFIDLAQSALKQVSVLGGPATTIATVGRNISGASWAPDDAIVFGGGFGGGLWRVSAHGGQPTMLTTLTQGGDVLGHNWPDVLPNGKGVLFTLSGNTPATSRIAVVSTTTGAVTQLISGGSHPRYASSGHIVYGVDGTLRAVGFDQDRLVVTGSPVPVVEGVLTKPLGAAGFSLASDGSLVYLRGTVATGVRRELVWADRNGSEKHIAFSEGSPSWPRLSPDGTRAAFMSANDVWVVDLARGTPSRVTDTGSAAFVFWHPDGRRVLFTAASQGGYRLFLQAADGTGKAEPLPFTNIGGLSPEGWTTDGRIVVSYQPPKTTASDIGILSPNGDAIDPFLSTHTNEDSFTISQDGHWIAYESDRTGQYEVYVERFPEGGDRRAISAPDGGEDPVWSHGGTELFFRRLKDKAMMTVPVKVSPTFTAGSPKVLFQGNYFDGNGRNYDVDGDGQRFLTFKNAVVTSDTPPPTLIHVQHFFEELKRLVPTN